MQKGECEVATITTRLEIVIHPAKPVPEILSVISAVCALHPGDEIKVMKGIQEAINNRLIKIETAQEKSEAN